MQLLNHLLSLPGNAFRDGSGADTAATCVGIAEELTVWTTQNAISYTHDKPLTTYKTTKSTTLMVYYYKGKDLLHPKQ